MSDWPNETLGGKTPLQAAKIPAIDLIVQRGELGMVQTVLPGFYPGSDVANMGILGYDPETYYTGRSPIEAAAMDITLDDTKIACRCNFVTLKDGVMDSFTAHHIETDDADRLIQKLNTHFEGKGVRFHTGVSYRHIAVIDAKFTGLSCTPPHDISDKKTADFMPTGDHADAFVAIMTEARAVLADGDSQATDIWLWGQGPIPTYPSFESMTGKSGGIVTAVDLLKGLAKLSGLEAPDVPGSTGFVDTNYANKWAAALDILDRHDFVYVHIEAPDESGHLGDAELKTKAIEDFDQNIVAKALAYADANPDTRILVLPDHPTPCEIKTHSHEDVPFAMMGPGVDSNGQTEYTEEAAKRVGRLYETPWELLGRFLG